MAVSASQFLNRNARLQGLKTTGSVQASLLSRDSNSADSLKTRNITGRSNALRNKMTEINNKGTDATNLTAQRVAKKKMIEAEKARQKAMADAEAERKKMMDDLKQNAGTLNSTTRQVEASGRGSTRASGRGSTGGNYSLPSGTSGLRGKIVSSASSLLGTPYAWGGGGYNNRGSRGIGLGTTGVIGVDCSGLTSYAYGVIGVKIPRHSNTQTSFGVKTSIKNARPGDIVGWGPGGHVAIYAGNGYLIEAAKPGTRVRRRKIGNYDYGRGVYAVRIRLPGE